MDVLYCIYQIKAVNISYNIFAKLFFYNYFLWYNNYQKYIHQESFMINKLKPILTILIILILTCYISTYWFQFTLVQGESMSPTLTPNHLVIIDKHNKTFHDGDIIVFYSANVHSVCIKRIIACPNESVQNRVGGKFN